MDDELKKLKRQEVAARRAVRQKEAELAALKGEQPVVRKKYGPIDVRLQPRVKGTRAVPDEEVVEEDAPQVIKDLRNPSIRSMVIVKSIITNKGFRRDTVWLAVRADKPLNYRERRALAYAFGEMLCRTDGGRDYFLLPRSRWDDDSGYSFKETTQNLNLAVEGRLYYQLHVADFDWEKQKAIVERCLEVAADPKTYPNPFGFTFDESWRKMVTHKNVYKAQVQQRQQQRPVSDDLTGDIFIPQPGQDIRVRTHCAEDVTYTPDKGEVVAPMLKKGEEIPWF